MKGVIHQCAICVRFRVIHAIAPTAPLPADRANQTHPPAITGTDFTGPVYVKEGDAQGKFTCATTRAIHLEFGSDITSKPFVTAFRRSISRKGLPSTAIMP